MQMSMEYVNMLLSALPDQAHFTIVPKRGNPSKYIARDMPGRDRRLTNISTGREEFLPLMDIHWELDHILILPMKVEIIP
jgi:hypothetical protein